MVAAKDADTKAASPDSESNANLSGGGGSKAKTKKGSKGKPQDVSTPTTLVAAPAPIPLDPHDMDPKDAQAMFQSLAAEADRLAAGGWFAEALETYTRALEFHPEDTSCLVNRSRCHMMLGDTGSALEDASQALSLDPTHIRGIFQKAEALYAAGHFEDALVLYHRGRRARPELEGFNVGIHKATEAIRSAVALLDPVKLRKKRERVKKSWGEATAQAVSQAAAQKAEEQSAPVDPTIASKESKPKPEKGTNGAGGNQAGGNTAANPPPRPYIKTSTLASISGVPSRRPPGGAGGAQDEDIDTMLRTHPSLFLFRTKSDPTVNLSKSDREIQERNLLEELYDDKAFLEELSRDDRFMAAGGAGLGSSHGGGEVGKLVEEGLKYLRTRVEFWRQRNPAGVPGYLILSAQSDSAAQRQKVLKHRVSRHTKNGADGTQDNGIGR
ncbi:Tetratricopeptide repeat protein 25 [Phlyctochytrium bullatum]|nr:Tetratricopeptide repeat protein 25 [Phlyctochytrium bullatum]